MSDNVKIFDSTRLVQSKIVILDYEIVNVKLKAVKLKL